MANNIRGIDFVAAANEAPPKFKKFKSLVIRYRDAHSVRTDLLWAYEQLSIAIERKDAAIGENQSEERILSALFASAVVLYARAVSGGSRARGKLNFQARFSPEQLEVHQLICELRNTAIAHVDHSDNPIVRNWHYDGVFLPIDRPDDLRLMPVSRRTLTEPAIFHRLKVHMHQVMLWALEETIKRENELIDEFEWQGSADQEFNALIKKHLVRASDYYGSVEIADRILSGDRQGATSFTVGKVPRK